MLLHVGDQATDPQRELLPAAGLIAPAGEVPAPVLAVVPQAIAERGVFTAGGTTYRWTDVLDAATTRGVWAALQRQTVAGVACARRHAASGEALDRAALDDSARRFRQSRGLLSGDEMRAWLERWGLGVADLREHLVRAHLLERWFQVLDETIDHYPVDEDQLAAALWPEAVCSGLLVSSAKALANDVALALEAGEGPGEIAGSRIPRIVAIADRARLDPQSEDAIMREVAANRLDWHRVAGESLELPSLDAAREAALMLREDGLALADVAERSGGELHWFQLYLFEVTDDEAVALLGAQKGDVIGPRARDGRFVIDVVQKSVPPDPADPDVRGKAIARLMARTVERALSAHVEWHEHL